MRTGGSLSGWLWLALTGLLIEQGFAADQAFSVRRLDQVQSFDTYDGFQLAPLGQTPELNIRLNKLTERIKRHSHPQTHHFLYVIQGRAELTVGDETRAIAAGDFVTIPQGTPHGLKRLGETEVLLLDLATPPDIGDVHWHE